MIRCDGTLLLGLVVFLVVSAPIQAQSSTTPDAPRMWDLSKLIPSDSAWDANRATVTDGIARVQQQMGSVTASPASLFAVLDEVRRLRRTAGRMGVYSLLSSYSDTRSSRAQAQVEESRSLETRVEQGVTFVGEEIRVAGAARLDSFMRAEPRLATYRAQILSVLRAAPHVGSPEAEALLRTRREFLQYPADTYFRLLESSTLWPLVGDGGKGTVRADATTYALVLRSASSQHLRDTAVAAFLGRLTAMDAVMAELLVQSFRIDVDVAHAHHFNDGIESALFEQGVPAGVRQTVVDQTRARLGVLHRYFQLRQRALGLTALEYPDVFRALPFDPHFTLAQTIVTTVAALGAIGPEYRNRLVARLSEPWWNVVPGPNRRDVWGIWPPIGGEPPLIFMSYTGDLRTASIFAGTASSMMKFADIPSDRLPDSRDDEYQSIYGNGTVNAGRMLHDDYLRAHATAQDERIAYLVRSLDDLRFQIFDNVRSVEFVSWIEHEMNDGRSPSAQQLSAKYLTLLREYYGQGSGVVHVPDAFGILWANDRYPYYVAGDVDFPLSYAVACRLVEGVATGDPQSRLAFTGVVGRGDSDRSYDELLRAGIDLADPAIFDAAFRRMSRLSDELEALLGRGAPLPRRGARK